METSTRSAILLALVAFAGHAGCSTSPAASGPDAAVAVDAPASGAPGLLVTWSTKPEIPGNAQTGLTIDSMTIFMDNLRVIGDAGPGDPRTSQSSFELQWDQSDAPSSISFPDAPAGLYSKVSLDLDGHIIFPSYEIDGHVTIGDTTYAYEIEDRDSMTISLSIGKMLQPGGSATIAIDANLMEAVTSVDFTMLGTDNGKLQLETADAQMPAFRDKLIQCVTVDNSGPN